MQNARIVREVEKIDVSMGIYVPEGLDDYFLMTVVFVLHGYETKVYDYDDDL